MNKKQLAKLLIKHPEIKALYESREFDASIINKIVAEEIMREDEDEEGEGRVSKADKEARDSLNAEDSVLDLDPSLSDNEIRKQFRAALESATTLEQITALAEEASRILDPRYAKTLAKNIKAAKARITGESSEAPPAKKEDSARKELIQSMKSEIEFLKTLLDDPETMSLDKKEYKEAMDEYIEKLEAMGVEVAKTDSTEDDKAFVQSIQNEKPEIEKAANAVKTAKSDDDFATAFPDLEAAIMASLKGSKDAAVAANDELDLSDIEIDDGSNDSSKDSAQWSSAQGSAGIPMKDEELIVKNVSEEATIENFPILLSDKEFVEKLLSLPQILGSNSLPNSFFGPDKQTGDIGGIQENSESNNGVALMREIDSLVELLKNPTDKNYKISGLKIFEELLFTDKIKSTLETASGEEAIQIKQSQIDKLSDSPGPLGDKSFLEKLKMDLEKIKQRTQSEEEATEEGTAAAVEAIENEVPAEVENIQPADVVAAEEKLEPEIKEDPQKQANAEELTNKVENKKMADKSTAESSWRNFNNNLRKSNVENKKELLGTELKKRLEIYSGARRWEDLTVPPLNHEISNEATAESFEKWKIESLPEIEKYFNGVLGRLPDKEIEELEPIADDIGTKIGTIDDAMNNDGTGDFSGGDSSGADVTGATDLETIKKILPQLENEAPNLFKFSGFVKNLAKALLAAEPSNDSGGKEGVEVDVDGNLNSPGTNIDSDIVSGRAGGDVDGLEESLSGIYLTEEGGVTDTQVDNTADDTSGQPLDVADATVLQDELEELRKILNPMNIVVDDLLTPDLKKALGVDSEVEPTEELSEVPSVEEATKEGQNAAQADAEQPDMKYKDLYKGFKEQTDKFFSKDGANDGFMDQFLLKYQARALAELLGTLDDIIRGDVPKDGKDNSGEARALSTATQQADNNLSEEQGQEISEKGQLELKTRLVAMLKGLKSLKAMMNSYKQYATRSSANPKLDGSALKKSLQRYMSNLQINIKAIVETCYIEHSRLTQTQSDAVDLNDPSGNEASSTPPPIANPPSETQNEQLYEAILEAIAPALEGVSLMEDAERGEKMEIVNTTFGAMLQIYEASMQSALETSQKETAMSNASEMMELAKKEEFVALFPTFVGSFGGKPQTIGQATDEIDGLLREFIETMKKVIVLAKGATIDETTLSKVIEDLWMVSEMMQNYFGVKSLLDDDMQAKVEKMLAQREEDQSLSDDRKPSNERSSGGFVDKAKDLAGKGLEKLKQMFSWMSDETRKLLLKFFGEDSELIDGLSNSDLSEEQQEALVKEVVESKTWYESLEQDAKSAVDALVKYLINEVGRDSLKQLNYPAVVSEKLNNDERRTISNFAQETQETFGKELSNRTYRFLYSADEEIKSSSMKLMIEQTDEFVSYLTTIFKIVDKISKEAAEEMVSPSQRNASNEPMDAEVEFEDEDGGDIEGLAKAPSTLKDRAIKMFEKKSSKSAPKPSEKGVSIFDYKSFASLLIFFMGQKNVNEETNAPSGKVNSGKDMETILKDGELSKQFFEVDDSLGGGLTKYAIKKYPFLSGVMSSLSKKFAPHFEKNNIELPNQTRPVQQQSDPSDVDPSADPFGDATKDQEPEEKPESKKIGLKASLLKISPKLRQEFINSKDVKQDNLSATTKFLAIAVVNSVMTETPIDPDLGAEVDLSEAATNQERSLFASQVLNKMKNTEMVEKIKTFMVDIGQGQKKYANLFDLYKKSINPPKESYTKLAQYLDAMTEKAKEVKEEGFIYKNAGNLTALNADLATEKPKSFALEESLRPIIEKMLNEQYNH